MEADIKILTDTIRQTAIISSVNFVPSVANSSLFNQPPYHPMKATPITSPKKQIPSSSSYPNPSHTPTQYLPRETISGMVSKLTNDVATTT